MHPNPAFEWTDRAEILEFVRATAFAHIFSSGENGLAVVHVPVLVTLEGAMRFHIARRNRAAGQLGDHRVLISVVGREGYQSANWYVSENQVPTWHYEAVEIEGLARTLTDDELVVLLDSLSAEMEERYSPQHPWTRAKMTPGGFEAMTRAIIGFEVAPDAIRATRKFNQHKSAEDRAATVDGLRGVQLNQVADAVEELSSRGTTR
jgi:transcriptional regulator